MPDVYEELQRLAHYWFRGQPGDHTLQPTALVHEVYLKLSSGRDRAVDNRTHFFALAATAMRQILVSHARKRQAGKRGAAWSRVPLSSVVDEDELSIDLEGLHRALDELAKLHERQARIVEYRFFGGLSVRECADLLGVSERTVKLDWHMARAWLLRALRAGERRDA